MALEWWPRPLCLQRRLHSGLLFIVQLQPLVICCQQLGCAWIYTCAQCAHWARREAAVYVIHLWHGVIRVQVNVVLRHAVYFHACCIPREHLLPCKAVGDQAHCQAALLPALLWLKQWGLLPAAVLLLPSAPPAPPAALPAFGGAGSPNEAMYDTRTVKRLWMP